jgi:hypothetical protein
VNSTPLTAIVRKILWEHEYNLPFEDIILLQAATYAQTGFVLLHLLKLLHQQTLCCRRGHGLWPREEKAAVDRTSQVREEGMDKVALMRCQPMLNGNGVDEVETMCWWQNPNQLS